MKNHTKVYMEAFGYGIEDFIPSEISGQRANDTHHIEARGAGGTSKEDRIENLMAVTRTEHVKYGDKKQHMVMLYETHRSFLRMHSIEFDEDYIEERINHYS